MAATREARKREMIANLDNDVYIKARWVTTTPGTCVFLLESGVEGPDQGHPKIR